jgi:hypothetical protein
MPAPGKSETSIVNQALIRIGQPPIAALDNTTPNGTAASLLYYDMRDKLLRRLRWNFARKFAALAVLPAAPGNFSFLPDPDYVGQVIYSVALQLPADYLRLSAVSPYDAHWRIVGRTLLTDAVPQPTALPLVGLQPPNADGSDNVPSMSPNSGSTSAALGIEYIAKIEDVTQFEPLFTSVLTLDLAQALCQNNTGLIELKKMLIQEREGEFAEARALEGMEQWPEQMFDTVMVDVRMGYSSGAGTGNAMLT